MNYYYPQPQIDSNQIYQQIYQQLYRDMNDIIYSQFYPIIKNDIKKELEIPIKNIPTNSSENLNNSSNSIIEQPKIEQPLIEQPKIEQPKIEQAKIEQSKIEQPKI
jgi:hypothetical protein